MTQTDEARAREIVSLFGSVTLTIGDADASEKAFQAGLDRVVAGIAAAVKQARREGAQQMREAAGKRIDDIATAWAQMPISQAYREIAISVRALPLPGDPT